MRIVVVRSLERRPRECAKIDQWHKHNAKNAERRNWLIMMDRMHTKESGQAK